MFEIVKRRHIRQAGNLVPRTSHGPQPCAPDMLWQAKIVFAEMRRQVFLGSVAAAERTSIMRVIKCRKSIWWMPWR